MWKRDERDFNNQGDIEFQLNWNNNTFLVGKMVYVSAFVRNFSHEI